jgi:hypothetical protein
MRLTLAIYTAIFAVSLRLWPFMIPLGNQPSCRSTVVVVLSRILICIPGEVSENRPSKTFASIRPRNLWQTVRSIAHPRTALDLRIPEVTHKT